MKLKYTFEIMEMDDQFIAVPVGDNASEFHGIVKFNATGAEILKMIQMGKSRDEIIDELGNKYETAIEKISSFVSDFFAQLIAAGMFE